MSALLIHLQRMRAIAADLRQEAPGVAPQAGRPMLAGADELERLASELERVQREQAVANAHFRAVAVLTGDLCGCAVCTARRGVARPAAHRLN